MTVGELLGRISSTEITEWIAYFRIKGTEEQQALDAARMKQQMRS